MITKILTKLKNLFKVNEEDRIPIEPYSIIDIGIYCGTIKKKDKL